MTSPAYQILSPQAAVTAARAVESPSEVMQFEGLASSSRSVREFLTTAEWAAIRERIMGDGNPPLGAIDGPAELARFARWTADGAYSEEPVHPEARAAYLHMAAELDALARRMAPAPTADELAARREAA
jgi:hypothetical protein